MNKIKYIIVIGLSLVLLYFIVTRYSSNKYDAHGFLNRIKEKNKYGLDSLQNSIVEKNSVYENIRSKIEKGDFLDAEKLIDSIYLGGDEHMAHVLKGTLFAQKNNFKNALNEFNEAILLDKYSIAYEKRAELYLKYKHPELALLDFKYLYRSNYYYSFKIASTFEVLSNRDSGVFYYLIYLNHYPNSIEAKEKIQTLSVFEK